MSSIGFIGLGNMGFPMASRLADAGHTVLVHDAQPATVERFLGLHPTAASGQIAGWDSAAIIITMLPTSAIVEQVLLDGGVADAALPGTLIIDMSSAEPLRSQRLAKTLHSKGVRYVDRPVWAAGDRHRIADADPADGRRARPLWTSG